MAFVLFGCEPEIMTYQKLRTLQKGMSHEQVAREITMNPKKRDTILVDGQSFVLDKYVIVTSQRTSTSTYPSGSGGTWSSTSATDITNIFVCLFEKDKLRYWGMIGDYSKSDDEQIQRIAPFIHDIYFKAAP